MGNFQFGILDIISSGPLLGFSYYPDDEQKNMQSLIYI